MTLRKRKISSPNSRMLKRLDIRDYVFIGRINRAANVVQNALTRKTKKRGLRPLKKENKMLNTLMCGDCLNTLKAMPDNYVDLVITSPPYNLGNSHHTGNIRHKAYNDDLPEDVYQNLQASVLCELFRVLKEEGSLLYNHKNRIKKGVQITPYQWLLRTPFVVKQELVWFNRSQNFDKIRFYPMTERIYWLSKKPETKLFNAINHHDLFNWNAVGTGEKHTRAFAEEMVCDFLKCFPSANIVLDPYMGSGTVAAACIREGRQYIGIEREVEYCEIAEERVRALRTTNQSAAPTVPVVGLTC